MATSSPIPGPVSDNSILENISTTSAPSSTGVGPFANVQNAQTSIAQHTELQSHILDTSCWTPSKRAALDPSRLQLTRIPRAWERAPTQPASVDSRFSLVWRRYDAKNPRIVSVNPIAPTKATRRTGKDAATDFTMSAGASGLESAEFTCNSESGIEDVTAATDPEIDNKRPVKKLRVGHSLQRDIPILDQNAEKSALLSAVALPTKWERRTSLLPRKLQPTVTECDEDMENQGIGSVLTEEASKPTSTSTSTSFPIPPLESLAPSPQPVSSPRTPDLQRPQNVRDGDSSVPDQNFSTISTAPPCENLDIVGEDAQHPSVNAEMFIVQNVLVQSSDSTLDLVTQPFAREEASEQQGQSDKSLEIAENVILLEPIIAVEEEDELIESHNPDDIVSEQVSATVISDENNTISAEQPIVFLEEAVHRTSEANHEEEMIIKENSKPIHVEQHTDVSAVQSVDKAELEVEDIAEDIAEDLEDDEVATESDSDDDVANPDDCYANLVNLEEPTIHFGRSEDNAPPSTPPGQLLSVDSAKIIPKSISPLIKTPRLDPPSPVFEEATATITLTALSQLEDDKAILQSFLDRAAARKSDKLVNIDNNCARQERLENRRHSDVIRQALASPRLPLEAKDANLFSPRKPVQEIDSSLPANDEGKEQNETATFVIPPLQELVPVKSTRKSSPRRSGRPRKQSNVQSQTPAAKRKTATQSSEEALTVLKTRQNTRKNKGAAMTVIDRLVKLRAELTIFGVLKDGDTDGNSVVISNDTKSKSKAVKWSKHLWVLDQATGQTEMAPILDNAPVPKVATINTTPGTLQMSVPPLRAGKVSTRGQTARLRKLGAMNGTPAKDILSSAVLPDEMEQDTTSFSVSTGSPKRIAAGAVGTVGSETKKAKSRLPAPKKLNLNPSVASVQSATIQIENTETLLSNSRGGSKKKTPAAKKTASLLPAGVAPKRAMRTKS